MKAQVAGLLFAGLTVIGVVVLMNRGRVEPSSAGPAGSPAVEPPVADARLEVEAPEFDDRAVVAAETADEESSSDPLVEPAIAEEAYSVDSWATAGPLNRISVPDSVFDALYPDDMTYAELYGAWSGKSITWQQESLVLGQKALGQGDYEERRMPRDAEGNIVASWIGHGDDTPHCVVQQGGEVPPDSARVAWLRYDEHPELYDRRDEWLYLLGRFQSIPKEER